MGAVHTKKYFDKMMKVFASCDQKYCFEKWVCVLLKKNKTIGYYNFISKAFVWNMEFLQKENTLIKDFRETHFVSFRHATARSVYQSFEAVVNLSFVGSHFSP